MEGKIIGNKLVLDGFIYLKSFAKNGKVYWDCRLLRGRQCKSRVVTTDPDERGKVRVTKQPGDHSHAPNQEECEAEAVVNKLKRKAEEHPEQNPSQILRVELARLPSGVLSQMPERENIKKAMRRIRRKGLPPNPQSLSELKRLPERYTKTLIGEKFLIYDSRPETDSEDEEEDDEESDRVLVFATRRNLEFLCRSKIWFVDGTFKVRNIYV